MAFVKGHPEYEAVEAMVRHRHGEDPLVRAIITRHDQSQVDHVNASASLRDTPAGREKCVREMTYLEEDVTSGRRAFLTFKSFRGESIELNLSSFGRPDATRGGLTDPGNHSLTSSLPIMVRGKSAPLAPESSVTIDGKAFLIPPRISVGGRTIALDGYVSESHHMAALRAGSVDIELVERPSRFRPGDRWVYKCADELWIYRIVHATESGEIRVTRSGAMQETILCRLVDARIELVEFKIEDPAKAQHFVSLRFSPEGMFSLTMDGVDSLVCGTVETSDTGDGGGVIRLIPNVPAWAIKRPVQLSIARSSGDRISVATTVG